MTSSDRGNDQKPPASEGTAEPRRLNDIAYERIKDDIITCRLEPGVKVSEGGLALELGLGKAPLRNALARLAQEGLVETIPRRGYRVLPITMRDVEELFALRALLEPAAARGAAGRVEAGHLRGLDAVCRAGYSPGDRESERRFLRANKDFHVAVARASGNRRLSQLIATLHDEIERLLHVGMTTRDRSTEIQHEHALLVDALEIGDGATAERLMAEAVGDARKMVTDVLITNDALREVPLVPEPRDPS